MRTLPQPSSPHTSPSFEPSQAHACTCLGYCSRPRRAVAPLVEKAAWRCVCWSGLRRLQWWKGPGKGPRQRGPPEKGPRLLPPGPCQSSETPSDEPGCDAAPTPPAVARPSPLQPTPPPRLSPVHPMTFARKCGEDAQHPPRRCFRQSLKIRKVSLRVTITLPYHLLRYLPPSGLVTVVILCSFFSWVCRLGRCIMRPASLPRPFREIQPPGFLALPQKTQARGT